jgi:hypothetical protein
MKGHIRERSPGRWAIVIDLPDPETGKRRRKWTDAGIHCELQRSRCPSLHPPSRRRPRQGFPRAADSCAIYHGSPTPN